MADRRALLGPEYTGGGPVADPSYHPAAGTPLGAAAARLQEQTGRHLFYDRSAAAEAFSHFRSSVPDPVAVAIMGLAYQRDVIQKAVDRQFETPFYGVPLGPLPSFQASPPTTYVTGSVGHLTHHAHQRRR